MYASFVIEKDGTISTCQIVKTIGDEFSKEVLRVLKRMPIWEAGMLNGNKVRVKMLVPIKFELPKEKKKDTE